MGELGDDDTQTTVIVARETLEAVITSTQARLQRVFIAFMIAFFGTFYLLRSFVWTHLEADVFSQLSPMVNRQTELVATTLFDVILLQVKHR